MIQRTGNDTGNKGRIQGTREGYRGKVRILLTREEYREQGNDTGNKGMIQGTREGYRGQGMIQGTRKGYREQEKDTVAR